MPSKCLKLVFIFKVLGLNPFTSLSNPYNDSFSRRNNISAEFTVGLPHDEVFSNNERRMKSRDETA